MHYTKVFWAAGIILASLGAAVWAQAELVRQPLEYTSQNQKFISYLIYDDSQTGKRPGVLVFPEWGGLNDYAKMRADQLARMGYVAMAVDIYGGAKSTQDKKIAGQWSGALKRDLPKLKEHARAALNAFAKFDQVDAGKIGAIGFCFGGTTDLALAYSGADLKGVVSFHGGLIVPDPADLPGLKAKILILHGAKDPFTPAETIQKLQTTLEKAGIDWQMVIYSGAAHGFTNPKNSADPQSPMAYNAVAEKRSMKAMRDFFEEIF